MRVGVVGLGTAGTAAALFLARRGARVHVFEKTPEVLCHNPVGAGIGLQPIGLTVLQRLGLLAPILEHGQRIDRLSSVTEASTTVLDLAYADFHPELYGVGLHRDVLFQALHQAAIDEPRITIEYGCDVTSLDVAEDDGGAADGRTNAENAVWCGDGRRGPFDLLVVADGRRSLRASTPGVVSTEYHYPYGCLWAILPDRDGAFAPHAELSQTLSSGNATEMLGFLPCGRAPNAPADAPPLVSLFWSVEMARLDAVRDAGLGAWKSRVLELEPRAAPLLDELTDFGQLIPSAYSDTWMPRLYHGSSTVFLGDAAHATSPQLGQGANLALVDAWALGEAFGSCADGADGAAAADAHALVRRYDAARRWRLRFYQLNSRLLTPIFQGDSRLVGSATCARDQLLGRLCYVPPTRALMLATLVGAQRNGVPFLTIDEDEYMGYLSPACK